MLITSSMGSLASISHHWHTGITPNTPYTSTSTHRASCFHVGSWHLWHFTDAGAPTYSFKYVLPVSRTSSDWPPPLKVRLEVSPAGPWADFSFPDCIGDCFSSLFIEVKCLVVVERVAPVTGCTRRIVSSLTGHDHADQGWK